MIERASCISVPPLSLSMPQPPFPHCNSTCTVGRPNQYMEYGGSYWNDCLMYEAM